MPPPIWLTGRTRELSSGTIPTPTGFLLLLYNDKTKRYVMFLKYDGNGAYFAIATANRPDGQFTIQKKMLVDNARIAAPPRPHYGQRQRRRLAAGMVRVRTHGDE